MNQGIYYLYEYETGQRKRNLGFLQISHQYRSCMMTLHVKSLPLSPGTALELHGFYNKDKDLIHAPCAILNYSGGSIATRLSISESLFPCGKSYLAAKKMMDIYDCNAFSTACHELCTTEIPQNRKFTPCMCHSIMKDEGIPSGCEEDLNALMAMLIMQYAGKRPAFMGNPNHETDELLRIHHAVPALQMNGYGTKPLAYKLWAFTGQGFGGKLQVDFTENDDDYITLGRFNPAGDTMCIKKGKVIRSEYADTYCSPFYYIQMDDAREFMHNLAGFGHHQVLIFGDYTKMIKKIAKIMNFNILEG